MIHLPKQHRRRNEGTRYKQERITIARVLRRLRQIRFDRDGKAPPSGPYHPDAHLAMCILLIPLSSFVWNVRTARIREMESVLQKEKWSWKICIPNKKQKRKKKNKKEKEKQKQKQKTKSENEKPKTKNKNTKRKTRIKRPSPSNSVCTGPGRVPKKLLGVPRRASEGQKWWFFGIFDNFGQFAKEILTKMQKSAKSAKKWYFWDLGDPSGGPRIMYFM